MNTLALIKSRIEASRKLADARITVTKYRGVDCKVHQTGEESHGTFCYKVTNNK